MATRVLIVDDEPGIRFLVRRILSACDGFEVVGEVADGDGAAGAVERLQPDIVLLDLVMPTPGDEVLPELARLAPTCMIAVFSSLNIADRRDRLLRLGAFCSYEKRDLAGLPDLLLTDYARFQLALDGEDVVVPWLGA